MKNKVLPIVLALAACLCLAGCGEEEEQSSTPQQSSSSTTTQQSSSTTQQSSSTTEQSSSTTEQSSESSSAAVNTTPVSLKVEDVTLDPEAGIYFFSCATTNGDAYAVYDTIMSADGTTITGISKVYIPNTMTELADMLANEGNKLTVDQFSAAQVEGIDCWQLDEAGMAAFVSDMAGMRFDEFFVTVKTAEMTAEGKTAEEIAAACSEILANAGISTDLFDAG